jgi:hypothetical protein
MIDIEVKGLDDLIVRIDSSARILYRHLRRAMGRGLAALQRRIQPYPAPPPDSSYKRTGTLGRRWQANVVEHAPAVRGILSNPTSYAPFVVGEETQATIHKVRWKTDKQAANEALPTIEGYFNVEMVAATEEIAR